MVKELIVVEGEKDAQVVRRAFPQADIMVTGGWRLSPWQIQAMQQANTRRGVIIFTDPDHAGEKIRRRLSSLLPGCKHAYISRKQAARQNKIGVEHASVEAVATAIKAVRTQGGAGKEFDIDDLLENRLAGAPAAARRRCRLGALLSIGYCNAKQFLWRLNALGVTREEFNHAVGQMEAESDVPDQAK